MGKPLVVPLLEQLLWNLDASLLKDFSSGEHLWPRSYGLTHAPSLTDLHNIRPADVNVNSARGNKYFGECHVGLKHCKQPATKEAARDTETDMEIWAPPSRVFPRVLTSGQGRLLKVYIVV